MRYKKEEELIKRQSNLVRHIVCTASCPSLRNLASGNECGRVLPAGVGPGSPSRDAASWLPSRFNLSVETRPRYGWLTRVFPGARLFRNPVWCPSGGWRHARGRGHCRREAGSALSGGDGGLPRNIRIEKHCELVKYTGLYEVVI